MRGSKRPLARASPRKCVRGVKIGQTDPFKIVSADNKPNVTFVALLVVEGIALRVRGGFSGLGLGGASLVSSSGPKEGKNVGEGGQSSVAGRLAGEHIDGLPGPKTVSVRARFIEIDILYAPNQGYDPHLVVISCRWDALK